MSADNSLEYLNITIPPPCYFFGSSDAFARTFLSTFCGSVRVAAICSRTFDANAPFMGPLLDLTPSIVQFYTVANKTIIVDTSKYEPKEMGFYY